MSEIDDNYKQSSEDLDTYFIEELKGGKKTEDVVKKYLKQSKKNREKFEKDYRKNLSKEKWKIWHDKKKKPKEEKTKPLDVKHFDFEPNFYERWKILWSIRLFNLKRFFSKAISFLIPSFVIYTYYKIKKAFRVWYVDTRDSFDRIVSGVRDYFAKTSEKAWKNLRASWDKGGKTFSKILGKIMFWKKPSEEGEKEGEEKSDEEVKEEKTEEPKA